MKKIITFVCLVLFSASAFAQEISLVVSGEGKTRTEATAAALRRAIEQSYGTFVSANTTLLYDDIVRNEIATVASGNIKSYKELSCVQNDAGIYNVSVNAVVSIGKLISYAKSHGSSAEFAGQTFVMNIKMRELNKKNEYEALQNLLVQLNMMKESIFDGIITVKDLKQLSDTRYRVPVELTVKANKNYLYFYDMLFNTLNSLSLSPTERTAYNNSGTPYVEICKSLILKNYYGIYQVYSIRAEELKEGDIIYLRNNSGAVKKFLSEVCSILNDAHHLFKIGEKGNSGNDKGIDAEPIFEVGHSASYYPGYKIPSRSVTGQNEYVTMVIPRSDDFLVGKHIINFDYTLEELGNVSGFEIKYPTNQTRQSTPIEDILDFADSLRIPYTVDGDAVKIPLKKGREIVIDFSSNRFITPDLSGEFEDYKVIGSSCDFTPAASDEYARLERIVLDESYVFIVIAYYDGNVRLNKVAKQIYYKYRKDKYKQYNNEKDLTAEKDITAVQAGGIETLLKYVKNKSEIRTGGSNYYNYEGHTYLVSVASVAVGTKSELDCKTVGAAKAKREMLAFVNGSEISSYTELKNSETETETLEGTKVEMTQEYTAILKERVVGMINQTVPLGGWYSEDKDVYYYAIYKIVE